MSFVGDPSSEPLRGVGEEESNARFVSVGVRDVPPVSSVAPETGGVLDLERSGVEVTELARLKTGRKMEGQLVAARRMGGRVDWGGTAGIVRGGGMGGRGAAKTVEGEQVEPIGGDE